MNTIVVELMIPPAIEMALNAGMMERVGGVIRYSDSKEIVAWLREGGKLTDELASNSAMMASVLSAAGMNAATVTHCLDGHTNAEFRNGGLYYSKTACRN